MFYITISNGLLENGHHERMGNAIWLFMWFIDKVTKIDSEGFGWVLGGKPINLDDIPHVPRRSAQRYIQTLKKEGYIVVNRTMYGFIVKVVKAKKRFQGAPKVAHPDAPKMVQRCAKNGMRYTKSGASNKTEQDRTKDILAKHVSQNLKKGKKNKKMGWKKYNENDHEDDIPSIDAETGEKVVIEKPKKQGKEIFALFQEILGLAPLNWKVNRTQRTSAENLMLEKGVDKVRNALNFYKEHREEEFCPAIQSPYDLDAKWEKLKKFRKDKKL